MLTPQIYVEFVCFCFFIQSDVDLKKTPTPVQKSEQVSRDDCRMNPTSFQLRAILWSKVVSSTDTRSSRTFAEPPRDNSEKDTSLKQDACLHQFAEVNAHHPLLVIWIFFVHC